MNVREIEDKIKAEEMLFSRIDKNDIENLTLLINIAQPKPNINVRDEDGLTPLMWAVKKDKMAIVKLFVDSHADVNVGDNKGETALRYAVERSNFLCVRILLDAKADIEIRNIHGQTPFLLAASKQNLSMATLLLEKKANPNAQNENGETALAYAAVEKNISFIKKLVEAKADLNVANKNGMIALQGVLGRKDENGSINCLEILLQAKADPNIQDNLKETPLQWAAFYNNFLALKILLESKAELNTQDEKGYTALRWAAVKGNSTNVKLLLEFKADANIKNSAGKTALEEALGSDCRELLKAAIKPVFEIPKAASKSVISAVPKPPDLQFSAPRHKFLSKLFKRTPPVKHQESYENFSDDNELSPSGKSY